MFLVLVNGEWINRHNLDIRIGRRGYLGLGFLDSLGDEIRISYKCYFLEQTILFGVGHRQQSIFIVGSDKD